MFPEVKKSHRKWLSLCFSVALSVFALPTLAASALNICAGKSELPFSNDQKQGFENKIAAVIGKSLNVPVNYFWWTNPLTLQKDMEEGKCDLLIGTDPHDPRVLVTKPYYRSGYVFVTRKDREIDITSWDHPYLKEKNFRIGVMPDSPGKNMLLQINRFDDMFDYFTEIQNFQSTRNRYVHVEPSRLVNDVANMHLHMAMLWAPEAARYVRASEVPLNMVLVDDTAKKTNGEKIPMHYDVVMGVSKQHPELVEALNRVIDSQGAEIAAILKDEGVPLLALH
ncbi:MAG: methanol oxidation system protein MoxJ [Methylophilus sp.]|uniref:methanol oxidation system protein MoxJ n=1 Tax=Methylophilus sp. TaxID=29541 RepID=UPI002CB4B698|nr:methanol oxidation system protein MoxJ [Methylophilus sp.]HSH86073.1 methanol oxidation system protein MoxJ [Methylophilus sp.]